MLDEVIMSLFGKVFKEKQFTEKEVHSSSKEQELQHHSAWAEVFLPAP